MMDFVQVMYSTVHTDDNKQLLREDRQTPPHRSEAQMKENGDETIITTIQDALFIYCAVMHDEKSYALYLTTVYTSSKTMEDGV